LDGGGSSSSFLMTGVCGGVGGGCECECARVVVVKEEGKRAW